MRKFAELTDAELRWSQPSALKKDYELRTGDELVGTLKFRSVWGTFAAAESAEGSWTFKRVGFFQNKVSVRNSGSDKDLAVFRNNTWASGGTLEFPDGLKFKATTNMWMTNLAFKTESNKLVIRFKYGGVFRRSALVEISALGREVLQLPLLVLVGWYLAIMLDSDSGAAAAVIATD